MYYKDSGIILNSYHAAEADKIATVLLRQHGKMNLVFKGVKKSKSHKLNSADIGNLVELLFYRKNEHQLPYVREIVVKNHFYKLKKDYTKFLYLNLISELFLYISLPGDVNQPLYNFLLNILIRLKEIEYRSIPVFLVFILYKLVQLLGIMPEFTQCGKCRRSFHTVYYNKRDNDFYCERCSTGFQDDLIPITPSLQQDIQKVQACTITSLDRLRLPAQRESILIDIFYHILCRYLNKDLRSYPILEEMMKNEHIAHC
ncbi:MAG: DNA repair protein RecO [bacterium]|nr:DNA repair protein RecO [bacterium]